MLVLTVTTEEMYDEENNEFLPASSTRVRLEHSLVSLSKWESTFEKSFLATKDKTTDEILGYIEMMAVDEELPPDIFRRFSRENFQEINNYIESKQTATTVREQPGPGNREIITAEVIYTWMIELGIPLEWENRHLSRLIMLIRARNAQLTPAKKMSRSELAARNRELNEKRKREMGTRG